MDKVRKPSKSVGYFWDLTLCSLVKFHQHFEGMYCPNLWSSKKEPRKPPARSKQKFNYVLEECTCSYSFSLRSSYCSSCFYCFPLSSFADLQLNPLFYSWLTLLVTCFLLVSCLVYSLTVKMEAVYFSEMLVNFYRNTWHHISEDGILHSHQSENVKSNYT
jgi:hypothetical protein